MTPAMTIPTDTEIIPDEQLTPADRRFLAADAVVSEAQVAVDAADDRLEAARAADAAESTAASRSELTKARRQRTAAGDQLIAAEEELARADKLLAVGDDDAEVTVLQRRIEAALSGASLVSGLYGRLRAVNSASGLSQLGPAHADALARFAEATRALKFQQGQAGWPKPVNAGGRHV